MWSASRLDLMGAGLAKGGVLDVLTGPKARDEASGMAEAAERDGIRAVGFTDDLYPPNLKKIHDPPLGLFYKGEMPDPYSFVSVVGSRKATSYGRKVAYDLSAGLARCGVCVVSGMARGIDGRAHEGALSAGGITVAVLGCGLNIAYPPENHRMIRQIAEKGAVISEHVQDTPPMAYHFPRRNRIISGMSDAVVVVEAASESGSLITADFALEQGREVFAVPGNITSAYSVGTNRLIRNGAQLCSGVMDILGEIPALKEAAAALPEMWQNRTAWHHDRELGADDIAVMKSLSREPLHIESICLQTGLDAKAVSASLLSLQLKNYVDECPGKVFEIKFCLYNKRK